MASIKKYYYYYNYILRRLIPLSEGAPSRFYLYILMHTPYCHLLSNATLFCSEKKAIYLSVYVCTKRLISIFPTQPLDRSSWSHFLKHTENSPGWCCCHSIPRMLIIKKRVWIFVPVLPSGSDKIPACFLILCSLLQIMSLD